VAAHKATYNVYVIELSRDVLQHSKFVDANPYMRADKPCVYVGSTYLTPEERYQQHLDGYKSNRYAHEYAIQLKPRLYKSLQGFRPGSRRRPQRRSVRRACGSVATPCGTASDHADEGIEPTARGRINRRGTSRSARKTR